MPIAGGRPVSGEVLNYMIPSAKELAEFREHLKVRLDSSFQPQQTQVNAAAADVPLVLREIPERDPYLPYGNPDPKGMIVSAPSLISSLAKRGHDSSVASWAVYRLIERGFLGVETAVIHVPKTPKLRTSDEKPRRPRKQVKAFSGFGDYVDPTEMARESATAYQIPISMQPGPIYASCSTSPGQPIVPEPGKSYASHTYLVVWATDELWDWWKFSSGSALSVAENRSDSESTNIPAVERTPRNYGPDYERDRWCREQYQLRTPFRKVAKELKLKHEWARIGSESEFNEAAERYAQYFGLPPRKPLRNVPLPDTLGFRELHNTLASASKEGRHVVQIQIAREIAAKHNVAPATLTRAYRRYQKAIRDNGQ